MSEHAAQVLIIDDEASVRRIEAELRHKQAMENIEIVGALHNAGLPLFLAPIFGARPIPKKPEPPRQKTQADLDRIAAAEAKRARKAAKFMKGQP